MSIVRRKFLQLSAVASAVALASPKVAAAASPITKNYQEIAAKLIGEAMVDTDGMEKLIYLCDRIGHRLAGEESLNRALAWSAETMKKDGLQNVVTPPVKVPVWIRGKESVKLLAPVERELPMLGLGGSIATPPEGITADVVVVKTFDELDALGKAGIAGKIVLYNMEFTGYRTTVQYRASGASRAAEYGALASLIRSVTPVSQQSPHTGGLRYTVNSPQIPGAALTVEDAAYIARMVERGHKVRVHLKMEAKTAPDADSANAIGEIVGSELPNEVVVLGGHIDSWDVGQGAQDDGSGCIAALQALAIVRKLGLKPRRTLRVCFWTNEENGLRGGNAYRVWSEAKGEKHVAALEMDGGAEKPIGFGLGLRSATAEKDGTMDAAIAKLRPIAQFLSAIHSDQILPGGGGADIGPLMSAGVPGLGLLTVGEKYFHWHHTHGDTVDKVDLQDFRACIATLAVMSYVLADMPDTLV